MKTSSLVRFALLVPTALILFGCSAESKKNRALERAAEHFRAASYEKALIEYQNVLQLDPENVTANERLAKIWLERGSPMRAAPYLFKMKAIAPGDLELRSKLGNFVLTMGKVGEARKEAIAILQRSSSFPQALVLLTETVRNQEDLKAADQELEKVTDKTSVYFQVASANLLLVRGDAAAAKSLLERTLAREPKSPEIHSALASFHASQNNVRQAAAELKAAAELSPVRSNARLKYAAFLAQTGPLAEAISYLNDLIRQAPDYMPAFRALTQIAIAQKKFDEAQTHLRNLLTKDPLDYEGRILRARLWLAQGDATRAIEDLERFGQDFPGLGIEKHQLALAYLQNNDQPKAITALQAAVGHNPDNFEALLLWAQLNLRAGAAQPVAAAMAELVTNRPNLLQAYPLLIDAMRALGRGDQAVRIIGQSVKLVPRNGQLHYLFGVLLNQQQKPAEARQSFEKSLELLPDFLPPTAELVGLDLKEGAASTAMKRVQALITKSPNLAAARLLAAKVHAAQGQWDEVETAILKTLELDPKHPGAHGLLAEAFAARRTQPATLARMEDFLAKRPNDELAVLVAGQVYVQLNDFTKARDAYEKFLSTKPDASVVLNNLAELYAERLSQLDRALELARTARRLEPNSPAVADTLGWILYRRKDYQEALPLLQESARQLPDNPEIQFHVGMANRMLGKNEAALVALRSAANAAASFRGKDEAKREVAALEKAGTASGAPGAEKPKAK